MRTHTITASKNWLWSAKEVPTSFLKPTATDLLSRPDLINPAIIPK